MPKIYILDGGVLDFIPNANFYDMPVLFERVVKEQLKIISFPIREYWLYIGHIAEFKKN
ncbi:hypothetical protein HOL24_02900 [bacterium]|jgi:NDP-sugar pyrophosphorylase family protein|nr:hypothetical protein [bacterium]